MTKLNIPVKINLRKISVILICESFPNKMEDYFYTSKNSLYITNTISAFNNAGISVKTIDDITKKGVYLTTAVKAPRKGLTFPAEVIKKYSFILEEELKLFPNIKVLLLMGDAAIKSLNYISQRTTRVKAIPAGSTYKIRKGKFYFKDVRVFPSYLQTGKNFLIEKSKREMVAEDIRNAFRIIK